MKKFINNCIKFSFIFFSINIVFYFLLYAENNAKYNSCDLNYDTFILSDSHGEALKNFTKNGGVYNFSFKSDSYLDMERKMNYLVKENFPKKIILTVDDHCFTDYRSKINNLEKSVYFTSFSDENKSLYEIISNKYIKYYLPLFNSNSSALLKMFVYKKIQIYRGLKKQKKKWSYLTDIEKNKASFARINLQFKSVNYSEQMMNAFNRILNCAAKHHVKVVLLKFPVSKNYSDFKIKKKIISPITISTINYENIQLLDFENIFFNNDSYFNDPDHLNTKGAKVFSKILIDSLYKQKILGD